MKVLQCLKGRREWTLHLKKREWILLPFCRIWTLKDCIMPTHMLRLDVLYSVHWVMLISPRNMLTDTSRNNASPALWASLSPVKLTYKISVTLSILTLAKHKGLYIDQLPLLPSRILLQHNSSTSSRLVSLLSITGAREPMRVHTHTHLLFFSLGILP